MTVSRSHPIRSALDGAAAGVAPSKEDLAAVAELGTEGIPGSWLTRSVKDAAAKIVETRRSGWNAQARREAEAATEEIVARLPEWSSPAITQADRDQVDSDVEAIRRRNS